MTDGRGNKRLVVLVVVLALVLGLVVLGVPILLMALQQAREADRRAQLANNLKQFHLALENYPRLDVPQAVGGTTLAVIRSKTFVDLTHAFEPGIPHWPGFPDEKRETIYWYDESGGTMGKGFFAQQFTHVGQWGTHCDAPAHFVEGKRTIDQIDPKEMILPLVVLDVHEKASVRANIFTYSSNDLPHGTI